MTRFITFAHRGASGHHPENTLRALRTALEMGASWLEVDVHVVENELVVIHDDTLERTTSGQGRVADVSLAYLRSLDAGKGERIPFLREVLDLMQEFAAARKSRAGASRAWPPAGGINVELKGADTAGPVADLIAAYQQQHSWCEERFLVSSFQHDQLKLLKELRPTARIGVLLQGLPADGARIAEQMGAWSVHVGLRSVQGAFVEEAHERGLKVYVFTVNRAEDLARMQGIGVDGVFTDYPELLLG